MCASTTGRWMAIRRSKFFVNVEGISLPRSVLIPVMDAIGLLLRAIVRFYDVLPEHPISPIREGEYA
jgi:hypothetical protein